MDEGGRSAWRRPLRVLEPFRTGSTIAAGAIVALGVVLAVGTGVGLDGAAAIVFGLIVIYLIGLWAQNRAREELIDRAFIWRGVVRPKTDPIKAFAVKFWSGWGSRDEPPPFVRRTAMAAVERGLDEKRFVLLTGNRTSGKSRLVYEMAKGRPRQIALVAAPADPTGADPLIDLMEDHHSLAAWEERQILVLRDFTTRLIARRISGESMRTWLDRHEKVSFVATVNPHDLKRIAEGGEEAELSYEEVAGLAAVVELDDELDARELEDARRAFPTLEEEDLRQLPRSLVLEHPLRERFEEEGEGTELGRAIVRAVADWQRAGLSRPAPEHYVRAAVSAERAVGPGELEQAMRWAIEPVRPAARLVYPVSVGKEEGAYEADRVIVDLLDAGEEPQPIPYSTWEAIYEEVIREAGGDQDEAVAAELIAIGEAAMAHGRYDFGRDVLEGAESLGNAAQQQRSAQVRTSGARIGSVIDLLVDSRRGDSIRRRIRVARDFAEERRLANLDSEEEADGPGWLLAGIYRRRFLRAVVRGAVLMLTDVFSTAVGLVVGLVAWALLVDDGGVESQLDVFMQALAPWAAATVFVFALLKLYKQDARRARLGEILVATGALGAIGMAAALAEDFQVDVAIQAAAAGTIVATVLDYLLRLLYEEFSRSWVEDHKLGARTLLLGRPEQVAAVEAALPDGISRPTNVRGYLTPGSDEPGASENPGRLPETPWLGSIEDLPRVVAAHDIARVLIADHEMLPRERQALADRCHLRRLFVEAVPSPSDVQAGTADFVTGQSLLLISLVPLWRRNVAFVAKRTLDFTVALVALIVLSPLLALIALTILAVDRTPIVVRSWRPGAGREVFGMYRFRTTAKRTKSKRDPGGGQGGEEVPTRLGGWLASHGLDELPQLWNILIGDMSLVGPRPLRLVDDAKLRGSELLRYVVRPGATSPWQVCGRETLSCAELTAMDMAYLRHWTIVRDFEILLKTAKLVFTGRDRPLKLDVDRPAEPAGGAAIDPLSRPSG